MPSLRRAAIPAAVILAVYAPLLLHLGARGRYDHDKELFDASVAREAVLRFHEPPIWNRYCGGGNLLLGNPETFCASPFFVLVLLFGAPAGLKLSVVGHALLGAWGMGRFVTRAGASPEAALFAAAVWPLTGYTAIHLAVGHVQWQAASLLPLVFAPALGAPFRSRETALAAGALGLAILDGGVHVALIAIGGCAAVAATQAMVSRSVRALLPWIAAIAVGLLLSGVKLIPSLTLLAAEPHEVSSHRGYPPRLLVTALFSPAPEPDRDDELVDRSEGGGYWEYGCYVGLMLIPLIVAGGFAPKGSERWAVMALGLAGLVLAADLPIWDLLHLVPPFRQERRPSRFVVLLVFAIVVLACRGYDLMRARRPAMARVLALLVAVDTGVATASLLRAMAAEHAPVPRPRHEFALRARGSAYENFLAGTGTIPCRQGLHLPQLAHAGSEAGYRGEAWIEGGTGDARIVEATSRRFVVDCRAPGGGLLVLNQNDFTAWTVEGASRASSDGLVAARVGPGASRVTFTVASGSALAGSLFSALGLLGLAAVSRRRTA